MATYNVQITGMTCGHCVMSVTEELEELGATEVRVDLVKDGVSTASVTAGDSVTEAQISGAVTEAGYTVAGISRA